jgi:hypothetical protein
LKLPTATHDVAEGHETPPSRSKLAPLGFGVGWIDQRDLPQRSTNVEPFPGLVVKFPTAVHKLGDEHDTPERLTLELVRLAFGVGWIDQLDPFHRSIRVEGAPVR